MQRSNDIRVVIKPWRLNGWPDASACSQVNDRVQFLAAKYSLHRVDLSKIGVANGHVFCETSNVRLLDLRIVKIIEIVEDDDVMIGSEQLFNQVRPDKAGTACHQDSHGAKLGTDGQEWTQILQLRLFLLRGRTFIARAFFEFFWSH
jgi:hypothetical protein